MHLAAGLSVGLAGLAAGYAIGIVGDMVCGLSSYPGLPGLPLTSHTGRSIIHAAVTDICGHGAHTNFCRSLGSLRVCRQSRRVLEPIDTDLSVVLSLP